MLGDPLLVKSGRDMLLTARLGDGLEMRRHNRADKIGGVTRLGIRRFGPRHNRLVVGSRPPGPTTNISCVLKCPWTTEI